MDAVAKIVVDIQNKDEIKRLQKDIENETAAIQALNAQLKAGTITQAQFAAATVSMGQKIASANSQMQGLQAASVGAGRGLSQLSYAVDDIQYGFNAIVNNIPQIVMGLGGSVGLAGAVGIAAVAVNQLIKHWGELSAAMQAAWSGDSSERILKLAETAEAASKAFDKLAESASKAKKAEAEGVAGVITEIGAENVAGNLAQRIGMDPGLRAEMTKEHERIERFAVGEHAMGNVVGAAKMRQQIQDELGQANLKTAKEMIGQAAKPGPQGDEARLRLRRLSPDIADDIQIQTPEFQKFAEQQRLELQGHRNDRKRVDEMKEDRKKLGQLEKDEWLHGVGEEQKKLDANRKRDRINALEDQRTGLLEQHHQQDLNMQRQKDAMGQGSQTLSGPKAVADFYQKAASDNPLVKLAQENKKLQEQQRDELKKVNANLEKERRVVLNR